MQVTGVIGTMGTKYHAKALAIIGGAKFRRRRFQRREKHFRHVKFAAGRMPAHLRKAHLLLLRTLKKRYPLFKEIPYKFTIRSECD